jgi:hypothetical protein
MSMRLEVFEVLFLFVFFAYFEVRWVVAAAIVAI